MRTLVGVVLDRSGSMASVAKDTIGGFNTFIETQRDQNQDQVYVLTQFDDQYEVLQDGVELDDVLTLNTGNYVPRGMTALLDAMGQTITKMDAIMSNDITIKQAIMVVLTDGDENSSKEFTKETVFKMVDDRRKGGSWEFIFLGAGQDAIKQGQSFGVAQSVQYTAGSIGTKRAFNAISDSVSHYSDGGKPTLKSEDFLVDDDS